MNESVPAPDYLTQILSKRALQIAQIIGPRKTGKGLNSLIPTSQTGIVGLILPDEVAYLFELNQGISEHAMVDLAGRVIPIRNANGSIDFRRASPNKIGQIPIITRSSKDGRIYTGRPEWVYPRKTGTSFMQKSIQMSVDEWKKSASTKDVVEMLMHTDMREDLSQIIYGKSII